MKLRRAFLPAAAILLCFHSAEGMPPLVYESALQWCDQTVHSQIPIDQRLYVLGPNKKKEHYILNGRDSVHELDVRQAVAVAKGFTLSALLAGQKFDRSKRYWVRVYRKLNPAESNTQDPALRLDDKEAEKSDFLLHPRDVVVVAYRSSRAIHVSI